MLKSGFSRNSRKNSLKCDENLLFVVQASFSLFTSHLNLLNLSCSILSLNSETAGCFPLAFNLNTISNASIPHFSICLIGNSIVCNIATVTFCQVCLSSSSCNDGCDCEKFHFLKFELNSCSSFNVW